MNDVVSTGNHSAKGGIFFEVLGPVLGHMVFLSGNHAAVVSA